MAERSTKPYLIRAVHEWACDSGLTPYLSVKVDENTRVPVEHVKNGEIVLILNTTEGKQAIRESRSIRREAVLRRVTYYTTVAAARATCDALDHLSNMQVNRLQDLHKELNA
ncbi:MAG: ClpXP protease specificity-enhancing factor SspB [Burkholderiales bacterium]